MSVLPYQTLMMKVKPKSPKLLLLLSATGYPQPMYRWLKNGIPVGDFDTSQYLKIQSTTREDAGSYQCLAKNDAGTIFSEKIDVVVACKYK